MLSGVKRILILLFKVSKTNAASLASYSWGLKFVHLYLPICRPSEGLLPVKLFIALAFY